MAGRKPGSTNKVKRVLPKVLTDCALVNLTTLVNDGDFQATKFILERHFPAFKPQTHPESLDAELIAAKIEETNILRVELEELRALVQELMNK